MLFLACADDGSAAGARDAALLPILYGIGRRRSEAVALDYSDYDLESGALTVRSGKGQKARIGYASSGAKEALETWLFLRGDVPGPMLFPVIKSGRIIFRRLTDQAVFTILLKRTEQKMAGDTNVTTRHDSRGEVAEQKAAELLHVPCKG